MPLPIPRRQHIALQVYRLEQIENQPRAAVRQQASADRPHRTAGQGQAAQVMDQASAFEVEDQSLWGGQREGVIAHRPTEFEDQPQPLGGTQGTRVEQALAGEQIQDGQPGGAGEQTL